MSFSVYFSSKKDDIEDKVHLAVVSYEGFSSFPPVDQEMDMIPEATFYEYETAALLSALEVIEDEGYDEVTLYNQNKLVFDWIKRFNHDNKVRQTLYTEVRKKMQSLADEGVVVKYQLVKGDKNEAKKHLKKYFKKKDKQQDGPVDLTALFKKKTKKTVYHER